MTMQLNIRISLIVLAFFLSIAPMSYAATYTFTTIDVSGATDTIAQGINGSGNIVGSYYDTQVSHGFIDVGGNFTTIDVPGATTTFAYGINDAGQLVGVYVDSAHTVHGFLATPFCRAFPEFCPICKVQPKACQPINLTICERSPALCYICKMHPGVCYPNYDPWWRFKCPACPVEILIRQGDDIKYVTMLDNKGREVGRFKRLKDAVVIKGIKYTHSLTFKSKDVVSYVLKAETAKGKKLKSDFNPVYVIRKLEGEVQDK